MRGLGTQRMIAFEVIIKIVCGLRMYAVFEMQHKAALVIFDAHGAVLHCCDAAQLRCCTVRGALLHSLSVWCNKATTRFRCLVALPNTLSFRLTTIRFLLQHTYFITAALLLQENRLVMAVRCRPFITAKRACSLCGG